MAEARTAQQIWKAALDQLQIQVSQPNYHTWLAQTSALSSKDNHFVIGVPNTFIAEYLDKNQRSLIEKVLTGLVQDEVRIEFLINPDQQNSPFSGHNRGKKPPVQQASLPLFNPKYTFDSFIVGSGNQLAYAAAKGTAENSGHRYNPLFIYGGAAVGKTHLLHAIGHAALAHNMRVLYMRAEQYTNQLISAIRERTTEDFHQKHRNVDLLLVDDVQFFNGKEKTGENFFHTFDDLHNANRQITIASNCPPKALNLLQERFRSRFEGGLVTDIQPPDFETRLAILQAKTKQEGVSVPTNVLELIALQIQQNTRALEGALNRVLAYARLIRGTITTEIAAKALKDINGTQLPDVPITPNLIVEAVVNLFQLTPTELKSRKKDETTVLARQIAMYLMRQETDSSLAEVGKELGGRSPATVSHAYQKIANDLNNNPSLRHKVFEIQRQIHTLAKAEYLAKP